MKRYKVLNNDLTSAFQNFQFKLGKEYVCDNFDDNPDNDCSYGFYATDLEGLTYSYNKNNKIFICEVSGKSVEVNQYKMRYEKIRIIKEADLDDIENEIDNNKFGYDLKKALFPINPLLDIKPKEVTSVEIKLLYKWDSVWDSVRDGVWASVRTSVRDSVGASVWDSVGASVWASVRDSVWDSVWASVWDSVRDGVWASVRTSVRDSVGASVWAYMSSIFYNIQKWEYIKHKKGINPFQPCIDLWELGLVPSFDGKIWRLHAGQDAKIVYEISKENLQKLY